MYAIELHHLFISYPMLFIYSIVFLILGTRLTTFRVTDSDAGDIINVTTNDAITAELVDIIQTPGNNIDVNITLKSMLDCDPVSL